MARRVRLFIGAGIFLTSFICTLPATADGETVRVGVYNNPPKVFLDEAGRATGFWPELTRSIAAREGWQLEWLYCPWNECLADLEANRIDVMVDVAVTDSRSTQTTFGNETVLVSWSRVYTTPGIEIETIPDLQGKRIGVMRESVNLDGPEGIRTLLERFAVQAEFVLFADYAAVAEALEQGRIDAGVTNRDFGNEIKTRSGIVPTPILLQPADLRYAFTMQAPRTPELIRLFDTHLRELKADADSVYYDLQEQWLGQKDRGRHAVLPVWFKWTLIGLLAVILVLAIGYALVEIRVRAHTRQLREGKAELEHNEYMLAESQRIASVGSWRLDLKENRLEWSDETYRIMGVSPETFTPNVESFLSMVHPDDRDRLLSERAPALQGRQPHDIEFRIIRPDGEVRYVYERAEAELDSAGDVIGFAGTIQDETEYQSFKQSLLQYRTLVEGSRELYGICDADYRYVLVNRAYAEWHGRTREEVMGASLPEILGEEYFHREIKPAIDRCLAGEEQIVEMERTNFAGEQRRLLMRHYPIDASVDGKRMAAAVITDITELREQARLVDIAGRVARLGGWSVDLLPYEHITWSDVCAEIHGMLHGYSPTLEEGINFYAPEWRDRIRTLYTACVEDGVPFDTELQLVNARKELVWIRSIGEPVRDSEGKIVRVQGALQDITEQKAADLEMERLSQRLTNILESITDAFFTLDRQWRFDYINREAERLLERSQADLAGRHVWTEFPEAVGTPIEEAYRRAMAEGVTVSLEEYYPPLDRWFDIRAYPSEEGLSVYFRDVSERHAMMEELNRALDMRQLLINALPAHIALLDHEGTILDVNDQWRHFGRENAFTGNDFGIGVNYLAICDGADGDCAEEARAMGEGLREVLAGRSEVFTLEYPCHSPDQYRWFRVMVNGLGSGNGQIDGAVVMHIDITERKLAERELERLAYQDVLTGQLSRNGLAEELTEYLNRHGWQPDATLVILDIEHLRDINDAQGYAAGDRLLIQIGRRLEEQAGDGALVARIGGGEFAVFLPARNQQSPEEDHARLAAAFETPFKIDDLRIDAGARFGFTTLGSEQRFVESLIREAEMALSQSRTEEVRGVWAPYTQELNSRIHRRIEYTRELRLALENNEFELHFQPKVNIESGELIGAEALLRWRHPERGIQAPGEFIPVAEQSQLIGPIGDWALRETCRFIREWKHAGLENVRVSVNVSLVQFLTGDFRSRVREALNEFDVDPSGLSLEITESVFERESESLREQLRDLHDMGVRLSLDDFGTGYSSLLYLQKYPFDEIKIDQGFVRRLLEDPYNRNIVHTVVGLAGALGAEVVAEGIESIEINDILLEMGCRAGQGFYYSKPLPEDEFRLLLENRIRLPLVSTAGI
ncbi:MAG: EAL domain-containing protein [Gammaproteobacteria bacterium]